METNNVLVGGPDPMDPLGELQAFKQKETPTQPQVTQQVTQESKAFVPVYVGGRKFDSAEELAQYTNDLLIQNEISKASPALQNANRPKPSELLYQDPDAFYELAVEDAERRVMDKLTKKEAEKTTWSNFFDRNKDLVEHRDYVEYLVNRRRESYKNLPVEEGLDKIATEARSFFSKVRGSSQGGKELPSAPAMVAGSSNGTAATQVPIKTEVQDFVSQLRRFQRRGK
jgi:hypothetical protein